MHRTMPECKIHRATTTQADPHLVVLIACGRVDDAASYDDDPRLADPRLHESRRSDPGLVR